MNEEIKAIIAEVAQEDLDSDDYGRRCHWCGAEWENTPEYEALQQHNAKIIKKHLDKSSQELGKLYYTFEIPAYKEALKYATPIPPDMVQRQVIHKNDCLQVRAIKVLLTI